MRAILMICLLLVAACQRPSESLEQYMDQIRPAKEAEKVRIGQALSDLRCTISVDTLNAIFENDDWAAVSWMLKCVRSNRAFFKAYDRTKPLIDQLEQDLRPLPQPLIRPSRTLPGGQARSSGLIWGHAGAAESRHAQVGLQSPRWSAPNRWRSAALKTAQRA